jgi:hypothetical protein
MENTQNILQHKEKQFLCQFRLPESEYKKLKLIAETKGISQAKACALGTKKLIAETFGESSVKPIIADTPPRNLVTTPTGTTVATRTTATHTPTSRTTKVVSRSRRKRLVRSAG